MRRAVSVTIDIWDIVSVSQIESRSIVCSLYSRITAVHLEQHCAFWPSSRVVKVIHSLA
jgi:hypothetical protein